MNYRKQANIWSAIGKANEVANDSWIGSSFMNADLGKEVANSFLGIKYNKDLGKWHSSGKLSIPLIGYETKKNSPLAGAGHWLANKANNLSPKHSQNLHTFSKYWRRATGIQGGLMLADMAGSLMGKKVPSKVDQVLNKTQAIHNIGSAPINESVKAGKGLLSLPNKSKMGSWYENHRQQAALNRIRYYQAHKQQLAKKQKAYQRKVEMGQIKQTIRMHVGPHYIPMGKRAAAELLVGGKADHVPDSKYNKVAIRNGMKHEAEHTNNKAIAKEITKDHLTEDPKYYEKLKKIEKKGHIRPASLYEIPAILTRCEKNAHEFDLSNSESREMLIDRTFFQNTFVMGDDLNQIKGFINGGMRPLTKSGSEDLYIRTVWVDPSQAGKGIAKELINQFSSSMPHHKREWMIINEDNYPMHKVASALGFKKSSPTGGKATWSRTM